MDSLKYDSDMRNKLTKNEGNTNGISLFARGSNSTNLGKIDFSITSTFSSKTLCPLLDSLIV